MAKLIKLLLGVVVLAVAGYFALKYAGNLEPASPDGEDQRPRVEEKFGFSSGDLTDD